MHAKKETKNLLRRLISITLAIAMIVGVLPFMAGRFLKASAVEVETYEALYAALNPTEGSTVDANQVIELGADIVIENTIEISKENGSVTINGGGYKLTAGSDDTSFVGPMFSVTSGALVLKDLTIEDAAISGEAMINNAGTLVMDCVSVIDNAVRKDIIASTGSTYINNSTFVGNTTLGSPNADPAIVSSTVNGETYILNSTIAGNDKLGVSAAGTTSYVVNSIVVSNTYNEKSGNLIYNAGTNEVAYSLYGDVVGNVTPICSYSEQNNDENKLTFNSYDAETGYPVVYDGIAYLRTTSKAYSDYGTTTYFDYSDLSEIVAGYKTVNELQEPINVLITKSGNIDTLNAAEVNTYQTGTKRIVYAGSRTVGASEASGDTFYTLKVMDTENGYVTGNTKKVYKLGERVALTAVPNEGYDFIRFVDETDCENREVIYDYKDGTSLEYELTVQKNIVISAEFQTKTDATVNLTVDGIAWPSQHVDLYQFGEWQYQLLCDTSSKYVQSVYTGTYDVYVNKEDSGVDFAVDESGATSVVVPYNTVSYESVGATGGEDSLPVTAYYPKGTEIIIASEGNLEKTDFKFMGWAVKGDNTETIYSPGDTYTLKSETVFLPYWAARYAEASVVVKLDDVVRDGSDFTVALREVESRKVITAVYDLGKFTARVENEGEYEILINDEIVDTVSCDNLTDRVYNYYSVVYDGNGNTDGQGTIKKTVLAGSDYQLINSNYQKTGNTFGGWSVNQGGTGSTRAPGETVNITKATRFYAVWDANTYRVTFDANGGALTAADSSMYINYGDHYMELPTPTRDGYRFLYWSYQGSPVYAASRMTVNADHTLVAQWTPVVYEITVPTGKLNFTVAPKTGLFTAEHDSNYSFTLEPAQGYSAENAVVTVSNSVGDKNEIVLTPVDGVYTITSVDADKTIAVSGVEDTLAPVIEISITDNKWNTFLNEITFGKFFNKTQNVTVSAIDAGVGLSSLSYYLGEAMSLEDLKKVPLQDWTKIDSGESFTINPNDKLVVYAMASDVVDNMGYVCSEGLILDKDAPVVQTISVDGLAEPDETATYIAPLSVKITDDYLGVVTVGGVERIPDANSEVVVAGSNDPIEIIATDMAGNVTEYTLKVLASASVPDGIISEEVVKNTSGVNASVNTEENELENMLITDNDKFAVDCGEDINIVLKIEGEQVVPEQEKELAKQEAANAEYTIAQWFDISLFKEYLTRGKSEKISETPEKLTFVIDVSSDELKAPAEMVREYYIGRVHEIDDTLEFVWLEDIDDSELTVTILTDKFSTYVLAYKDAERVVEPDEATTVSPSDTGNATQATPDINDTGVVGDTTASGSTENTGGSTPVYDLEDESLANTGDTTPIIIVAVLLVFGITGFIFFDRKRKAARVNNK